MVMCDFEKLCRAMGDLDEDYVLSVLQKIMREEENEAGKAMEACQKGMDIVGDRFSSGEYFVSDLIFAGEIMTEAVEIMKPALANKTDGERLGEMILCTVEGDLHDIGKNIVKSMLEAAGFSVVDLGIDTKPQTIVETAKERGIRIIGLSGVLSLAIDSMGNTIQAFKQAGMRDDVKIIIGGCPVSEDICKRIGADAWAHSPTDTVAICRNWAQN